MLTINEYKEYLGSVNLNFYNEIGKYFETFPDKDKRYNRIYFKLKAENIKIPTNLEIHNYLNTIGFRIKDYTDGICYDKENKEIRIGKILNKFNRPDLIKKYSESKTLLKNIDNLSIVISRHPYDCIGMSTRRGWTSCHDLYDGRYSGKYLYQLKGALTNGCLLCYLIRDNDRNINNPIARARIDRYGNRLSVSNQLGTYIPEFTAFLQNFTSNYNNRPI